MICNSEFSMSMSGCLTILAAHMLHGPGCPQLDTRGVKALQQGKEGIKRPTGGETGVRAIYCA